VVRDRPLTSDSHETKQKRPIKARSLSEEYHSTAENDLQHLRRSRREKISVYSSEYASGFFAPAASHLPAAPFPRNEGLLGQTPTGIIHKYLLQRPILSPGAAFLIRSPDGPPSPPASPSRARSPRKGRVLACLGWAGDMKASFSAASRRHS
jgi:hypothetical protein